MGFPGAHEDWEAAEEVSNSLSVEEVTLRNPKLWHV